MTYCSRPNKYYIWFVNCETIYIYGGGLILIVTTHVNINILKLSGMLFPSHDKSAFKTQLSWTRLTHLSMTRVRPDNDLQPSKEKKKFPKFFLNRVPEGMHICAHWPIVTCHMGIPEGLASTFMMMMIEMDDPSKSRWGMMEGLDGCECHCHHPSCLLEGLRLETTGKLFSQWVVPKPHTE